MWAAVSTVTEGPAQRHGEPGHVTGRAQSFAIFELTLHEMLSK